MAKGICMCCLEQEVEAYEAGMRSAILVAVSSPTKEWHACADHSERRQMSAWRSLYDRIQMRLPFPGFDSSPVPLK